MFELVKAENGVEYLRSTVLAGCIHGFSTRIGGVSAEKHTASLNLAFERGDSRETVLENVRLFASAVGFDCSRLVSVPQIHSSHIITVSEDMFGAGVFSNTDIKGDGYVLSDPGMFAAIKTADCVPVLMFDPVSGIASAVHAGWRGTFARIVEKGINAMVDAGANVKNIRAAIGPAINGECYEVGKEVCDAAQKTVFKDAEKVFLPLEAKEKYLCDLKKANRLILEECGVLAENMDVCGLCTHCEADLFYSHRASGGLRGTMMSVIGAGR